MRAYLRRSTRVRTQWSSKKSRSSQVHAVYVQAWLQTPQDSWAIAERWPQSERPATQRNLHSRARRRRRVRVCREEKTRPPAVERDVRDVEGCVWKSRRPECPMAEIAAMPRDVDLADLARGRGAPGGATADRRQKPRSPWRDALRRSDAWGRRRTRGITNTSILR